MTDDVSNEYRLHFAVERITPAIAVKYLEKNDRNRKASRVRVKHLADAIKAGEWAVNGEAIKFTRGGQLLDGQHRLKAIFMAGVAVDSVVIRGLDADSFQTLDGGKVRSHGDCLYVLDYKNPNALAAATRLLIKYESRTWGKSKVKHQKRPTNADLLALIKRHPNLPALANTYMLRPQFTPLIPHSVGMFCFYLTSRVDPERAKEFFAELSSNNGAGPAGKLHDVLVERAQEYIKPSSDEKCAWVIQAWNAFYNGKPMQRLSRIVETVPRFHPDPVPADRP